MTVLVTGGAGYIGSHMVHALVDAGEPVVVLDNLSTGFRSALPASVPLFIGDVGDHKINAVIHFAGSIVVPDSLRDSLGYYRNNTVNTRALIESAVKGGVKHLLLVAAAHDFRYVILRYFNVAGAEACP